MAKYGRNRPHTYGMGPEPTDIIASAEIYKQISFDNNGKVIGEGIHTNQLTLEVIWKTGFRAGRKDVLFYFPDTVQFTAKEFVGLTRQQALELWRNRPATLPYKPSWLEQQQDKLIAWQL